MTHFRRYEFKKRRYCSTPAVANLHDFSDNFVELLKVSKRERYFFFETIYFVLNEREISVRTLMN